MFSFAFSGKIIIGKSGGRGRRIQWEWSRLIASMIELRLTNSKSVFAYSSEIRYKNEFDEEMVKMEFRQPLFGMDHHFFFVVSVDFPSNYY